MSTLTNVTPQREPVIVGCAACRTHSRPLYVPWNQHAVGCPVRAADLERHELQLRALRVASSIAAFGG